ncbi:hypothetical protein WSM22_00090 [Cytophagales bacterium WSM2-2]|nr:hypothetical protein WSM22_00090 [Cytophagales bacterium WSM2-2]
MALGLRAQSAKVLMDKGDKLFGKGDLKAALDNYEAAEKIAPTDPQIKYRIGHVFLFSGAESRSLAYLENAYKSNPNIDPDIDYFLGLSLQANFEFKRAIEHFKSYKSKNKKLSLVAEHKIKECTFGDSLVSNPILCNIKILEWPLNSRFQDYGPVMPADESVLIFTSARDTSKLDKKNTTVFEDIVFSKKENNKWTIPEKISPRINDTFHDAVTYLTPDGKSLFLYYEKGSGDIYQSDFDGREWSTPRSMGPPINTTAWETSGCLAPDGKRFFFTSDRPGGFGGLDIYVSEKLPNGAWGKAKNLGPAVNTAGNEDAPFFHQDGTLYFGSDGHPGLGDYDIFKTEMKDGKWMKPMNLGYPLNTPKFENYFFLSVDKKRGFFSSIRHDGIGKADICSVVFLDPPPKPKPKIEEPVVAKVEEKKTEPKPEPKHETKPEKQGDEFADAMVSLQQDLGLASQLMGQVLDSKTAKPLRAQITLVDNKTNAILERVYSNDSTGAFKIVIPHGGNYGINTSVDGYIFNSMNFEVPMYSDHQEIETAIFMQEVEVGSKVVMKNIFFSIGKAELRDESVSELERILDLMQRNPGMKLQINGHTDSSGDADTNKSLSLRRAENVMSYLVGKGITPERLKAVGYGEERPIVSNDDETGGREINRRTEIEVIENQSGG